MKIKKKVIRLEPRLAKAYFWFQWLYNIGMCTKFWYLSHMRRLVCNALSSEVIVLEFGLIVRGDRDSRANLMPIYCDLYQIKL